MENAARAAKRKVTFSYSTIGVRGKFLPPTKTHNSAEIHINSSTEAGWLLAVRAAQKKQATDILVLDLTGVTTFTDYFVICSGSNARQNQAIADSVGLELKRQGDLPGSVEGYDQGEWILSDYGDFLVHVFSAKAREYYSLERLWREARRVLIPAE